MPLDYNEFAEKIKQTNPEFRNVDNYTLAMQMVEKYPQYKSKVDLKKKEVSQSTLDQDNTSSDRLSTTTTQKPTVSSSSKGEGIYTISGQPEGVFYKKQSDGWYKKQHGVYDYKKVTDQNRIKQIEANTVVYKPQPKEEIYILDSNPGALYKRSGNKWMKKIGNDYVFLKGDRVSERENILNKQARKATKFELDRLNVYSPGVVEKEPEQKWVDPNPKKEPSQRDTIEYWDKLLANKNIDQKTYDFHADRLASMGLYKSVVTAAKPKETADKSQELFEKTFKVYEENDPEFIRQEQIDKKLTFINSGFVGMDEEDVVSKLREVTNGYDYIEIEESGAGYDEILVKNKITGESKKISLDNWTSDRNKEESNRLYGWLNIQMNSKDYSYAYQKVKDLTEQIRNATPYDRIALSEKLVDAELVLSKEKDKRSAKAMTDENMESAIFTKAELENVKTTLAEVQLKFEDVKAKKEAYEDWSTKAKEAYEAGKISQEDYNNIYLPKLKEEKEAIRQEAINVNNQYLQASSDKIDIDQVAASNYLVESKRGNLLTGTTYAFLKGAENSWRFLLEQDTSLNEGDLQGFLTQLAPGSVSDIYTSSEGRSTLETLVFGLAESGGSAIAGLMTGSPGGATLGLYAASYVNMKDQMNAPEFRDIPEIEKILMSATFGATVGLLEKYGLSKMFSKSPGGKGLTNWILKQVVKELPENATAEMFELAVKNNYKAALANGLIQVNAAGFIEGSTELAQESSDMILKDVFNELNGKKYFENPKTWGEVFDRLGTSFKLGYLGGAGMNSITQTAQTSKTEITKYQLNNIEDLITNPTTKEIYKLNIKDQVLLGNMTVKDAKQVLSNLDELEATVNKIPKEIKDESKYQAFQLLNERDNLQKEIAGKDPALVAAQTERINAINEELKTISKNAVQERSTEEVLPREPETAGEAGGQREGMGQGVQGEIITEEGPITEEEKVKRISELEGMIASDNASKQEVGQGNLIPEARQSILEELQTLKESKQEVAAPKAEIGGIIRGYESISEQDNVGDVRSQLPNQNQGIAVVEGKDGNQYAVAFSRKGGDGKNIFEQGVTTPRPGYISASVKIEENATPEQIQAAQQEAQRNLDVILPTVVGGSINAQAINDVMAQQAPVVAPVVAPIVQEEVTTAPEMGTTVETDQVAVYRAEEQAELLKAIPKIESYKVNGEIDKSLMPAKVLAKYNEIYNKYDKLISPLLETATQPKAAIASDNEITEKNVRTMSVKYKRNPIVRTATNILKALPGVKIYLHENTDQYSDAIANKTGENKQSIESESSAGSYFDGEIHLDMSQANTVTLLHEAVHHALMVNGVKGNYIIDMANGLRGIIKDEARLAELDAFIEQYEGETDQETLETRSDEFVAQLGGILAANQEELTTTGLNKFKALINRLFKKLGLGNVFTKESTSQDAVNFINAVTRGLNFGEDVSYLFDPGDGGEVGTFNIPKAKFQKTKSVAEDPRDFIRELVEDADLREFNGQKFITNMYDYTNAGETDLGNGFKIDLLGGKNYVPLMMSLKGKKLGEVSNLAAFNTKAQAETFIRNADKSGAELFAPHSGTLSQSWQFQQHTFAELFNLVLDKGILTPNELIDVFNNTIKNSAANQANFEVFAKKYGENIDNFDSFESDPKKIIELLDIKNNYSPKLRKALNNAIASNKNFQKAIGVNNKDEFYKKIMDPLNQGMTGGEIMNVVKFDPNTFEIVQTKENDTDHHPSFGWTLLAKINGIYQPTDLYKSSDVTESYTKYNKKGEEVSRKADEPKFEQKNVSSSAGAIPKVAELDVKTKRKKQLVYHGGDVINESDLIEGDPLYVSQDKKQAELYAKEHGGSVAEFDIDETKMADEELVYELIDKLGLKAGEGWIPKELNLYELIDPMFEETAMSQSDINKLFKEITKRGYDGIKFTDTNLETLKQDIENYVIIDPKKTIFSKRKKQLTTDKDAKPGYDTALEALGETEAQRETWRKKNKVNQKQKRNPIVEQAAKDYYNEDISQEEYLDIVSKNQPIKPFKEVPDLPSLEEITNSLDSSKVATGIIGLTKNLNDGEKVASRLDIPAYEDYDTWVVSLHDGNKEGKSIAYGQTAVLKNVDFKTFPGPAIRIAMGTQNKSTIARMFGEWVNEDPETVHARAKELMNDPAWTQVGMNPFRYSWFYDKTDGMPLASADEVVQVGALVLAKNAKKVSPSDPMFETKSAKGGKIKFQKAPKILGQKPKVVIVNDEAKALADQIKFEVRAQREQKKAQTEVRKSITDSVKALVKKGSINLKQASTVISTLNRVNLDNPEMVKRFNEYVAKVFDKAEYIDKVERATRMKNKIKKNLKGASNPFAIAAKGFSQLNPKWVEDIDDYIEVAQAIYDSVRKSQAIKGVINWKKEADFQMVAQYVFDEEARQTEILLGNLRSLYERITGKPSDNVAADVMQAELKDLKVPEDFNAEVLNQIEERLAEFEQMVEDSDPEIVKKAASIDPTIIPTKESIRILDALDTYFTNGSIAGLSELMNLYVGKENATKFKGKAKALRALRSKKLAQVKFEQSAQLNMILERKFRTKELMMAYKKASGIQDIENGANKAEAQAMKKQKEYLTKFGKVKGFRTAENIFQRGALANLLRTMVASEELQQEEFDRNISILRNSVDTLSKGNAKDRKKAGVYKKVLTDLGVFRDDVSIDMVLSKAKKENVEAVNFVIDMFADIVDPLSDLALGMYNQILTQDINYTPYVYKMTDLKKTFGSNQDNSGMDFFGVSNYANQTFDKNKAGILMPITRPKNLQQGMHIDLDFDNNMFRQYRNALVDLYTAGPIRQFEGFFNSEENEKILGSNEDLEIIKGAMIDYVRTKKGSNYITKDGLEFLNKITDYMAQFGAARALVGVGQFINQFSSGMTNTIINAGEYIRPGDFSKEMYDFMANSGRSIANVGGNEIRIAMSDVDKSIEAADLENRPDQYVLKFIAKENMRLFNIMVAYPDAVARMSAWMAYYRKSMVEQGLLGFTESIDTTKMNDKAADYAQMMVDRNMDATDAALRGSFFRNRTSAVRILRSIFFPFSSFGINQKNRMWNDLNSLFSGKDIVTSSRSLVSIAGEQLVYNSIRYYVAKTLLTFALSALGYDEDDQEELYRKLLNNTKLSSYSKFFTDIVSPAPVADYYTLKLANMALKGSSLFQADQKEVDKYVDKLRQKGNLTDEEIEDKKKAFEEKNARSFYIDTEANKGSLSIQWEKAAELTELFNAWNSGEYTDDYNNERFLSKESRDKLTIPLMMKFAATIYGTRELDQIANKSFKIVKDVESMSKTQKESYSEIKKELGRDLNEFERDLIKAKKTTETAIDEIKFVERNGGLRDDQKSEYIKLLEVNPSPTKDMLRDIQNGMKADQIIKKSKG